ncbi:MAG: LacI family DNA-binding transcriptional regulator [Bifidobacteriaceae bacterium]|jgi:LacI family transcriptional regulator|nr:LacI family DNA-binding transcriptional regulator [Bifidobacteriaceae bacterium]
MAPDRAEGEARVTMAQLAGEAGTSVATVSKVLGGRPGVSAAKRDQVLAVAEAAGYRPRGGGPKPRRLIELVMRGIDTLWATQMLVAAEAETSRAGVGRVLSVTHRRPMGNRHWLANLAARRPDGLVLVVSRLQTGAEKELMRLRIPTVLVDPIGVAPEGMPVIGATNFAGGLSAAEHLISLGHRKIGIIAGDRYLNCSQERLDGYRAALIRAGIEPREDYVRFGDFQTEGGRAGAESLLSLPDPPTAIFAGSDQQAYGAYVAARAKGLRIPEDLSVVGFDDVPLAQWVSPRLTTVRQPLGAMAAEATRLAMRMAYERVAPVGSKVELATEFVLRDSTAPPRAP